MDYGHRRQHLCMNNILSFGNILVGNDCALKTSLAIFVRNNIL